MILKIFNNLKKKNFLSDIKDLTLLGMINHMKIIK